MTTQMMGRATELGVGTLVALLFGRFVANAIFRIVYPLLALLATNFTVDVRTASLLITIQVGVALLSPIGGRLADLRGDRFTMLTGMAILCVGALGCALASSFEVFLFSYAIIAFGSALYMPAVQTYASARSAYAQRGRILGILETSWALSALVGVTLLTALVEWQGTVNSAYWVFVLASLIALIATFLLTNAAPPSGHTASETPVRVSLWQPNIVGTLGFIVLQLLAVELVFVVYAVWLQADFAASTAQLGLVFGILGIVELVGSIGAALFTDRIGKRRAVLAGFTLMAIFVALLPFTAGQWGVFLVAFLIFGLAFEFAIVSMFPLISGLVREGRGTLIALSMAMVGLGRIIGSLIGPRLFDSMGFGANALLAVAMAGCGLLIGLIWLREGDA